MSNCINLTAIVLTGKYLDELHPGNTHNLYYDNLWRNHYHEPLNDCVRNYDKVDVLQTFVMYVHNHVEMHVTMSEVFDTVKCLPNRNSSALDGFIGDSLKHIACVV